MVLSFAAKYCPAGATTNSNNGVTDIKNIYPALEAMQKYDLVFAVHGEVTNKEIDIYDREAKFIENVLEKVAKDFPDLRIVFEHISTSEAVDFVSSSSNNIAATITAHHLLFNRNDMFAGGIRPHYYCLPVLKRNIHQQALIKAAISGNKKFFIGTDSAPHSKNKKKVLVVVLVLTQLMPQLNCMQKHLTKQIHLKSLKVLQVYSAQTFISYHEIKIPLNSPDSLGGAPSFRLR